MQRGRKVNTGVRDWIIEQALLKSPDGLTMSGLRHEFRKTDFDFMPRGLLKLCHELALTKGQIDRGYGQKLHVSGWDYRRDRHGRRINSGKPAPIFTYGPGENAAPPAPTRIAVKQRTARALEREQNRAAQEKLEVERRRALKRRPVMDELSAALFGRPIPRSK